MEKDILEVSDGYHTFRELYEHRHSLCLALMKSLPNLSWISKRHEDGELCFGDGEWFIAGIDLPSGTITYHLPMGKWQLALCTGCRELERGKEWDGHTPEDVVQRLQSWVSSLDSHLDGLCKIRANLNRAADFSWDEGSSLVGRRLDQIISDLDNLIMGS